MRRTVITKALVMAIMLAVGLGLAMLGSHRTSAQGTEADAGALTEPAPAGADAGPLGTARLSLDAGLYGPGSSASPGTFGGDAGIETFVLDAGM